MSGVALQNKISKNIRTIINTNQKDLYFYIFFYASRNYIKSH